MSVQEPYSRPPKRREPRPARVWSDADTLEVDDGLGECTSLSVEHAALDLNGVTRFDIENCRLNGVFFDDPHPDLEILLAGSVIEACDASRLRFASVRASSFRGVKLVGADFSEALVRDTEFHNCVVRLTNFRMATLERVRFVDCTVTDADAYGAEFRDVSFEECDLEAFNIDRVTAERTDLRHCRTLELSGFTRLDGFLVADHQLPALSYQLANAVGLKVDDADT